MKKLYYEESGLHIVWGIDDKNELRLLHFSALPFHEEDIHVESMDFALLKCSFPAMTVPTNGMAINIL